MLVPHRRKNPQFGKAGRAADQRQDPLVFILFQTMLGNQLRCDLGLHTLCSRCRCAHVRLHMILGINVTAQPTPSGNAVSGHSTASFFDAQRRNTEQTTCRPRTAPKTALIADTHLRPELQLIRLFTSVTGDIPPLTIYFNNLYKILYFLCNKIKYFYFILDLKMYSHI